MRSLTAKFHHRKTILIAEQDKHVIDGESLNIAFHQRFGFEIVGVQKETGFLQEE